MSSENKSLREGDGPGGYGWPGPPGGGDRGLPGERNGRAKSGQAAARLNGDSSLVRHLLS